MYRVWNFLADYSLLLVIGALVALVRANLDAASHRGFAELKSCENAPVGQRICVSACEATGCNLVN